MCGLEADSGYDPVLGEQRPEQRTALPVPLLDGGAEGGEDHLDFDSRARSYCYNWVSGECLAHDNFSIDTRNVGLRPGKDDLQHGALHFCVEWGRSPCSLSSRQRRDLPGGGKACKG